MERMEWKFGNQLIDGEQRFTMREEWPAGPWDDEPDKVQWPDEATGLACLVLRNRLGAWCGYVGLPAGHPWRDKDKESMDVDVHGGLTFGPEPCMEDESTICHVVHDPAEEDVQWIGFDCLHFQDSSPGMIASERRMNELHPGNPIRLYEGRENDSMSITYKPLAYVTAEVTSLAAQVENAWTH